MSLVKENVFEHVRAVRNRRHHMRYGLGDLGFTLNNKLRGQYQALQPVMWVSHLADLGKVQ